VGSNNSGADRRLRRKQGGEAGAALRFFKALPRGCRKSGKRNSQGPPNSPAGKKAPVQQRRPLPAAEAGRSCWGCGQQDARAAQGTTQPLGAATRVPFYFARLAKSMKNAQTKTTVRVDGGSVIEKKQASP